MPQMKNLLSARYALGVFAFVCCAFLLAVAARGAITPAPPAKAPQRIVSLNLCSDQYLLAVADRRQIAGLTHNAADREMSAAAAQVKGLRVLDPSAEEILAIDPDLLVGMPARRSAVMAVLKGRSYSTLDMQSAESFPDIAAQIRLVAKATGHVARGEALIARMQRDLASLPKPGNGRVAAYYQRRGYLTGTGTLVDDLMQRVGLVNLAGKLGKPPLSRMSLEEMVAARPDFIIIETATDRVTDQGTEMLHHPALRDIPRIRLPQAWTVCGGPAYVQAARSLVDQIGAH